MTLLPMPLGKSGSPEAQLTAGITAESTYIPFDTSILDEEVPNIITVGVPDRFECIWYTSFDVGGVYTTNGGQRGFDGTTALSFDSGAYVARYVTRYDLYANRENIKAVNTLSLYNIYNTIGGL